VRHTPSDNFPHRYRKKTAKNTTITRNPNPNPNPSLAPIPNSPPLPAEN
jgi:hypothetical protein